MKMSLSSNQTTLLTKKDKQHGREKEIGAYIALGRKEGTSGDRRPPKVAEYSSIFASSVEAEKIFANFHLPKFSKVLQEKLNHSKLLDNEEKKMVVMELGDAISNLTYYPPIAQQSLAVEMFLRKYPYVVKGVNPDLGKEWWVKLLQEHFVQFGIKAAKKRKNEGGKEKHETSVHCKRKVDNATQTNGMYYDMSLYVEKAKNEWLEQAPDTVIEKSMRTTFENRRSFITNGKPQICVVRERFPALFHVDGVKNDFLQIIGKNQIDVFKKNLRQFSSLIFNLEGTNPVIQDEIFRASSKKNHFDKSIIPILLIPSLLGENLDFLCFSNKPFDKEEIYPWINCNGTLQKVLKGLGVYQIYAENILICEPSDLIEAMYCLIACYWVFSVQYSPKCLKTLQIFETLFLEIEEYFEESETPINEDVVKLADILKGLQRRKKKKTNA